MNKAILIERIAKKTDLTRAQAALAVETFFQEIKDSLIHHETVQLVSFGSFKATHRKSRRGRNPKTGENIQVPEKHLVKFTPGKFFKETIRENIPPESITYKKEL